MVDFKKLKQLRENQKQQLNQNNIDAIIKCLDIDRPLKSPLNNHERIVIQGTTICCIVFKNSHSNARRSGAGYDEKVVELVKAGYTIVHIRDEYDPDLPAVFFIWHPNEPYEYCKLTI
jgi:hypothetical protein